jgi:hypothetical protein
VILLAIGAEKLMYKHVLINYPILVATLAVGLKVRVIVDARLIHLSFGIGDKHLAKHVKIYINNAVVSQIIY